VVTNNPDKIRQLSQHGVEVSGRIPHVIPPNEFNRFYLETKARRSGHMIDLAEERLSEQSDPVLVEGMPR
jgi:GTP cyclohydrolase II